MKVLIVNSDTELANFIGLVLYRHGHQTNLCSDIADGREQLALMRPDLLIISKRQVDNDRQAFYSMRAIHSCPFLLIGDTPGSTADALFRPDLLPFPFRPTELVTRVENARRSLESISQTQLEVTAGRSRH